MSDWTMEAPGRLRLSGTEFLITHERGGDFAIRYKGKPVIGCGGLGYAKLRVADRIREARELGVEPDWVDGTVDRNWK